MVSEMQLQTQIPYFDTILKFYFRWKDSFIRRKLKIIDINKDTLTSSWINWQSSTIVGAKTP